MVFRMLQRESGKLQSPSSLVVANESKNQTVSGNSTMASWYAMLLREPTYEECMAVALRYVGEETKSWETGRAEHAAEAAVWGLLNPRSCLDWPRDATSWSWPELSSFFEETGRSLPNAAPAFYLSSLVAVRVRAWVVMTLAAHGPTPRAQKRDADDWALAKERFEDAQAFDVAEFRANLEFALERELGSRWKRDRAARHVLNRLVEKQEANKSKTVDDFYQEVSSFMKDAYSLEANPCQECAGLQAGNRVVEPIESALPPFHLACSCEVGWEHSWVFDTPRENKTQLDQSIQDWSAAQNGLSAGLSIRDLLSFEKARMLDEAVEPAAETSAPSIPFWKRLFSGRREAWRPRPRD
jgi:hypothetical protein